MMVVFRCFLAAAIISLAEGYCMDNVGNNWNCAYQLFFSNINDAKMINVLFNLFLVDSNLGQVHLETINNVDDCPGGVIKTAKINKLHVKDAMCYSFSTHIIFFFFFTQTGVQLFLDQVANLSPGNK